MAAPMKVKKTNKVRTTSPANIKKKKLIEVDGSEVCLQSDPVTMEIEDSQDSPVTVPCNQYLFKDPSFVHSNVGAAGGNSGTTRKTRVWKSLKQIVAVDRALPWQPDEATYGMIDAPPSFKPAMKYSDLSGLPARYTDPQTKLRYATAEEYTRVRMMPSDLVTGCLALRKANTPV